MDALLLAGGLLVGGLIAWFVAYGRGQAASDRRNADMGSRLAGAESTATEVRKQLEERDAVVEKLQHDLQSEQQARITAQTRLDESIKNIDAQRKLIEEAQTTLKDTFTAISTRALRGNSEEFTKQVVEKVRPLADALQRYETEIKKVEQARQQAYGSVTEQLKNLVATHTQLSQQTTSLATALRSPQVKGRWGEMALRRAVEVAGLSPHCDFKEQVQTDDGENKLRPDLIVTLPGNRTIVVDAKTPTSAYLDAVDAEDASVRGELLAQHARSVRQHMQSLSSKSYWSQFERSPDFVVMFIPGESFFSAALEQDRELIEEGIRKKVILASPTTLIALLRSVAHGWQQSELVENSHKIGEVATELYQRICKYAEHFAKVGDNLSRATRAYNDSVGSWEYKIRPMGTRISELGVKVPNEQAADLESIDVTTRSLPEPLIRTAERQAVEPGPSPADSELFPEESDA